MIKVYREIGSIEKRPSALVHKIQTIKISFKNKSSKKKVHKIQI